MVFEIIVSTGSSQILPPLQRNAGAIITVNSHYILQSIHINFIEEKKI